MNRSHNNGFGKMRGGFNRLSFFAGIFSFSLMIFFIGCKGEENLSPEQKLSAKGKGIYIANCTACHNQNPKLDGPVGPSVANSTFELLKVRIRDGEYPQGYKPKRESKLMTKFPFSDEEISALEVYLKQ
ncbi:cytochrome C [Leptospira fainei serovar Hurstbridge str. BUT 6]|uniref:Cytochrome C n=1 Tax=Leptospira fainei serovar Hurstbridge str. BUT 6 TaxID=1193011 RepID=S3UWT2_9LEPT|nr:cytochrome c [Leptospira fainei]EPG73733.1 cytochrome C [Leptospira fainei serovar Hurstbridge str. BUT 6]